MLVIYTSLSTPLARDAVQIPGKILVDEDAHHPEQALVGRGQRSAELVGRRHERGVSLPNAPTSTPASIPATCNAFTTSTKTGP